MTRLERTQDFWNPLFINGKYEVNNVNIYDKGQVVCSFRWLSDNGSNNDYPLLQIDGDIKKKIKIDLTKDEFFYIRANKPNKAESVYDVYIPASLVLYVRGKEVLDWKTKTEKHYKVNHSISLPLFSKKECYLDENKEAKWRTVEHSGVLSFQLHGRFEVTEFGDTCQAIADNLRKKENMDISQYDIEKILKHYTIS